MRNFRRLDMRTLKITIHETNHELNIQYTYEYEIKCASNAICFKILILLRTIFMGIQSILTAEEEEEHWEN